MSTLPKGWTTAPLDKICQIVRGVSYTKNVASTTPGNNLLPILRANNIQNGSVILDDFVYIPAELIKSEQLIKRHDILVAMSSGSKNLVGKAGIAKSDFNGGFGTFCGVLRPLGALDARYVGWFTRTKYYSDLVSSLSKGVNINNLKPSHFSEITAPIAPLNEQIRIADKLDSILAKVDRAQARLDKIPGILKRFRQSVLAAATSGELTKEWRESRSNKISHDFLAYAIEDYDSKPLPELPPGWIFIPFEHAADIKSNLVDPKLTPNAIHLAPNHIEQNTGKILEITTVAEDGVASSKHKFFSGQIIYSKIRPYLNKVCLVDFDGVCSADMYPIEAKSNTKYLLYFMLSEMFVHWTSQQQGRVVLPKINQKALNKIPVALPPEDEQIEIVRRVDELLSRANTVEKNFVAAKGWFDRVSQSVLAKAFRGELVTQDQNDEPANELLMRIKSLDIETKSKKIVTPKLNVSSTAKIKIEKEAISDEFEQLESALTNDLDAEKHEVIDSLRVSYQAQIQKAQELLIDAKFSVEQFRSITGFNGGYDELKALIMNLLKGIPSVSEPLLAVESWDEKSGDYLMRLVNKK